MMNKLDKIDIGILSDLVRRELDNLENDKGSVGREQYEFYLKRVYQRLGGYEK
ncbi:MAG: hypothetical protein HFF36_02450 [Coprobacillus sp.]|nr:hypothetical protein [Coprobacillus sp.]